jgi:hypothetical protein
MSAEKRWIEEKREMSREEREREKRRGDKRRVMKKRWIMERNERTRIDKRHKLKPRIWPNSAKRHVKKRKQKAQTVPESINHRANNEFSGWEYLQSISM